MYLYGVVAILFFVALAPCERGKFAWLAYGHKPGVEFVGYDGGQYETS